jgi:hypothetical protein
MTIVIFTLVAFLKRLPRRLCCRVSKVTLSSVAGSNPDLERDTSPCFFHYLLNVMGLAMAASSCKNFKNSVYLKSFLYSADQQISYAYNKDL